MALNAAESADLLLVSVARVSTFFSLMLQAGIWEILRTNHHVWAIITLLSWNQHCNESINLASKLCSLLQRMFTFFPSSNSAPQTSKMIVTKSGLFEWESEITQLLEIHKTSTKNGLSTQNESQFQLLFARWRAKRCIVNFSLEFFIVLRPDPNFWDSSHHQIFNFGIWITGKSESIFLTLSFYANLSTNPCICHQNLAF